MENTTLKKTALFETHKELGGKIVEFAGYEMPIVYSSIMEEHKCVRSNVGMFDVSHMGEFKVSGKNALALIQKVTVNDASKLAVGQVQYSAMCYPDGGIVDDLLVYRFEDHYMLVVNAANLDKDFAWILENKIDDVKIENQSDMYTLLAVQGPKSMNLLKKLTDSDLDNVEFYHFTEGKVAGHDMIISRTGYTGELGYELYMMNDSGKPLWDSIIEAGKEFGIQPIGLGARDTLRLEKKMCLYGNDITKDTNPIEAGLSWITKLDKGDFNGSDVLKEVKENGPTRRLICFELEGRGVPRHGYEIFSDGEKIGEVTSGSFSPILKKSIGLGYCAKGFTKSGTKIDIDIRGKMVPAEIVKPPFV